MAEGFGPPPSEADGVEEGDIIRVALARGLITPHELACCRAIHDRHVRRHEYRSLLELLFEQGAMTRSQAERINDELRNSAQAREIPGYEFLAKLGQGAMGVVYKAKQLSLERVVAIKVLSRQLARNKEFITVMDREARLGARISSEHVPQIIDRGEINGQHYLVMEYVEGVSIAHQLEGGKVFEEPEAMEIAIGATRALVHLDRARIVHRDVKPGNLVLTPDSMVKLMDLGLARHTADWRRIAAEAGTAIGTPYYISPEQIRGDRHVDIRSDMYSLGATLYHMVTGQPPFVRHNSVDILEAHQKDRPTPPHEIRRRISGPFSQTILKLLAKNPDDRFPNPQTLLKHLEKLRALTSAPEPATTERRGLFGRKREA